MPKWLRRYLYANDLGTHLWRALWIAVLLRLASAVFVYGPQALDDYKHGVWPAYQMFAGEPLDLPDYRSHLLNWLLAGALHVASLFGVSSALAQVRAMYVGLGLLSLSGIYGTYLAARSMRSRLAGPLMLYLTAAFPLMPFVSTRAFGEAVAMGLVALGFGWLGAECAFLGFLALGMATLFRFHVGILFVAALAIALYDKRWRAVLSGLLAGIITLGAEALIDVLSGKTALATLFTYLAENEGGGARYGVSPWYNPWLFVLMITLAPFSFAFVKSARGLWSRQWRVLVPWLLFVFAHSVAAHKEERFLYPILALELWALAYLWSANALTRFARRVYTPLMLGLGAVGLMLVCFVNTQEGEIEPPAYIQSHFTNAMYLDYKSLFGASRFQFYFLRQPSELAAVGLDAFSATRVDDELARVPERQAVALLTSEPDARDQLRALEGITTTRARCQRLRAAGSLVDRALYAMNPKHNQRRRPTWYLICERSGRA